jgi:peptide-methionine (S)-S-oxide reductase
LKVPGVIDTVVGYTGNPQATVEPNYDAVCFGLEWVEGVRVKYEDEELSYEQLLDAFFEVQEPKMGSRQYASIIFPHDREQREAAERWRKENASRVRSDGVRGAMTSIEPLSEFFQAEGYHQRYWTKFRPRIAAMVFLLASASGLLDPLTPETVHSTLHSASNAAVLLGCAYVLLERILDARVVKL